MYNITLLTLLLLNFYNACGNVIKFPHQEKTNNLNTEIDEYYDELDETDTLQPENGHAYFLDNNNELQLAAFNLENPNTRSYLPEKKLDYIHFYLYTRKNPKNPDELFLNDIKSIINSHFNHKKPTKIIIHGFVNNINSPFVQGVKDAYVQYFDYNIIAVDWGKLCPSPWYLDATRNTMLVGQQTAKLIELMMQKAKLKLKDIHIVGHSLGAHVAGITGKNINASSKIQRITGLDPALPLYKNCAKKWKLTISDAVFVDVIHTSSGELGFKTDLGHSDFYPNGGTSPQPGCGLDLSASCSHSRSWEYFKESIVNAAAFPTNECDSLRKAMEGKCTPGSTVTPHMGENSFYIGSIMKYFYAKTKKDAPFSDDVSKHKV